MKIITRLSQISNYIANGFLVVMMMLTVADVFLRFFFNSPIAGTTELTEFLLVIVVFPAFAWCAMSDKHVKVTLFMDFMPKKTQRVVDIITLGLTLFIFALITWQSFLEAGMVDTLTSLLLLPVAPFYWVLTFGFALFTLAIAAIFIEKIVTGVKK